MVVRQARGSSWLAEIPPIEAAPLRPGSTVADVVRTAIGEGVNQLLRFAPGVSIGTDPEDVHKARVATRKMRSHLKSFSVALDPTWVQEIRTDLGWLAGGLGAVRDADVTIDRIRRCAAKLPPTDRTTAQAITSRLDATRDGSAQAARAMLESSRCQTLIELLHSAASGPPVLPVGAERAQDLARPLVSASWRRLERSVSDLPGRPSDEDLHEVRIRTKVCRYTTEILVPIMGGRSRRLARELTELQGVLGDIHDSQYTQGWLRTSADSTPEALVAGMMVAHEAEEHAALLRSWRDTWLKVRRVAVAHRTD